MVVAGNLVFFGQSEGYFDALDAKSGKLLWSYAAGMAGMGAPNGSAAVYEENGVEYVVMAFGGNVRQRADYATAISQLGDALVAFALPQGNNSSPHVVKASPKLIETGAPETYPPLDKPSPDAKVIELTISQLAFTPNHITVAPDQLIAFHIINKGLGSTNVAFDLPTGPIGPEGDLGSGKSEYFQFYSPSQPGTYQFYGPGDLKFQGMVGTMTVK
jgi:plastocyanin